MAALAACGDNSTTPPVAQCADGVDNDGDGNIDFPADPGCADAEDDDEAGGTTLPKCNDGQDNDGDGKTDYPNDPGCFDAFADDEADDCPSGPNCPACSDGQDDDENGVVDYPDDPGCSSAGDDSEFLDQPNACGQGLMIKQLPPSGVDMGMLTASSASQLTSPCGGGAGAPAVAYLFILSEPKVMIASTDNPTTTADTVIDLRSENCSDLAAEIACHDDVSTANKRSTLIRSLQPGSYYLIVQGKTATATGDYQLDVQFFEGEGEVCAADADCGPGLVCRIPANGSTMVCSQPVCNDGLDDDGDGKVDFPADPGCSGATDATEADDCPSGVNCPQCGNAVDDDLDGMTDFPADLACTSASSSNEACQQSEAILVASQPQTSGTTVGMVNDYTPPAGSFNGHPCSSSTATHTAPDVAVQLDLPATTTLSLRLTSPTGGTPYNSAHVLLDATCGGTPIECYDSPSQMVLSNLAAGRRYLIVDGASTASGAFILHVSGSIVNGESCEMPLAQSGALTCGSGYACKGTVGSRTCQPAECNDGVDNNADGKTDYGPDPGCASPSDDIEDTVCPGANCPVCADGLDNDTDGQIDYPADTGCIAASANNEGCAGELDPIAVITSPSFSDTLVGASDDHDASCVLTDGVDKVYTLDLPTLQELVIDTEDSTADTVLSFMTSACTEPALACDDDGGVGSGDSKIVRPFVVAGRYTLAVDMFGTATPNTFNVNISGTIVPGGSCEGPLASAFHCSVGFACSGPVGSQTCQPSECLDGLDNNGDGRFDFPNDPGCSSSSDGAEDSVCPGPSCPQCADGVDNDMDGATDFPADAACFSASSNTEGCLQSEPIGQITGITTTGTTTGGSAFNDSYPTCTTTSHAAPDIAYELEIPTHMATLNLEVTGFSSAIHSFYQGTCNGPSLACSDANLMVLNDVTPGSYYVVVDASGTTTTGTYTLTTTGTAKPGEACESDLFVAGAFTCTSGHACKGAVGSKVCAPALCADGIDNNGDGFVDFPNDPGCTSTEDDVEDDICPGPNCPECGDTVDNDGDSQIDFGMDTSCRSAAWGNESCPQTEATLEITEPLIVGTTTGKTDDFDPSCGTSGTRAAPDVSYQLDLPGTMTSLSLIVDPIGSWSDTHALLDSTCTGTPISCTSSDSLTRTNVAPGRYYLVVDGFSTASGDFYLTTTGVIATGQSCESPLVDSGAFTCAAGHACKGPLGMRTCEVAQCGDGMDNNGDGLMDYPADPSCTSTSDDSEETVCPGPSCPACFDMADNDGDMLMDFPADTSCPAAAHVTEACTTREAIGEITAPYTAGTTSGQFNDHTPICGTTGTHSAPDLTYQLVIPGNLTSLTLDLKGFSSAHALYDSTCGGTPVACSDPETMVVSNVNAGTYYLVIDGFSTSSGPWVLATSGTIAAGQSCEGELADSGALTCDTGTTCTGMPGLRTCQ